MCVCVCVCVYVCVRVYVCVCVCSSGWPRARLRSRKGSSIMEQDAPQHCAYGAAALNSTRSSIIRLRWGLLREAIHHQSVSPRFQPPSEKMELRKYENRRHSLSLSLSLFPSLPPYLSPPLYSQTTSKDSHPLARYLMNEVEVEGGGGACGSCKMIKTKFWWSEVVVVV